MEEYPRYLREKFEPFDPLELALKTERIVSFDSLRKYTSFYCVGVYGGISTGYTVGCCLRCVFCWVDWSRDFPEKYGQFYSPQEVFENLVNNAKKKRVKKLRISGGEPTLNWNHLLEVLRLVKTTNYLFILESNGILIGANSSYAKALEEFPNIHLRISLKAGTPEGFEKRTGAKGEFYELPFQAIAYLSKTKVNFHVASMSDPRLMPDFERQKMIEKLVKIGYRRYLEEEICDPYDTTKVRLNEAGWHIF